MPSGGDSRLEPSTSLCYNRRGILRLLAGFPAALIASCIRAAPPGEASSPVRLPGLIDVHCHVFNITDLPASAFIAKVTLGTFYRKAGQAARDGLLATLRAIEAILRVGVTTAHSEANADRAAFMGDRLEARALSVDERARLQALIHQAEAQRTALARIPALAGDVARPCERNEAPSTPSIRSIVAWLSDLRSSRASLVRRLVGIHERAGYGTRLLCPALVDYSNWIEEDLLSPLPDQVEAGGRLAREARLPPVHGYVAFDPLRRALFRKGLPSRDGNWDPLSLARHALVDEGFIGVKVYPPMGFRASGNAASGQRYPERIERLLGGAEAVGHELDVSLDELWRLCEELDAPVLTHTANSNGAGEDYGRRADPAFWLPVLIAHPRLRVSLGHFGRFGTLSDGQACASPVAGSIAYDATWEAVVSRREAAEPGGGLFADLSYLSIMFDGSRRGESVAGLRRYLAVDPGADHLLFGSDWVMIGIERQFDAGPGYAANVAKLLQDAGFTDAMISKVMLSNAIRFLGLTPSAPARDRILAFYVRNGLPRDRLLAA